MFINILLTVILSSLYLFIVCLLEVGKGFFNGLGISSVRNSKREKIYYFLGDLSEKILVASIISLAISVFVAIIYSIWFL